MPTDKERAEVMRELAAELTAVNAPDLIDEAYWNATSLTHKADQLDPPKPVYPDGTVAWVTGRTDDWLCVRVGGEWCDSRQGHRRHIGDRAVTNVEPLRVLADNEIALPRNTFHAAFDVASARKRAEQVSDEGCFVEAALWNSYAEALEAEGQS